MAHTPGRWEVFGSGLKRFPGIDAYSAHESYTVVVYGTVDESDQGVQGRTQEEAEANARLIAAAPDLLVALKRLLRAHVGICEDDEGEGIDPDCQMVRDAIAKAEGPS